MITEVSPGQHVHTEHCHHHHTRPIRPGANRFYSLALTALLFTACPGDDIAAILASVIPSLAKTAQESNTNPNEILGMYWTHLKLERHQPQPDQHLLNEE